MEISVLLAGVPIELGFRHEEYLPLYEKYITDKAPAASVSLSEEELTASAVRYEGQASPAYVEHMELCAKASNALLEHDRVFFHGTAFLWRKKAWILAAASGTGKTTQYCRWAMLYPDEVRLINGDKPIIECGDEGVVVHHSPWRGKENMGQELSAPLGGIILLEQAKENRIERLGREAIIPVFRQFIFRADCASVKKVFALEDKILRSVPVFRLYNLGDEASTRLCRDTLEETIG